MDLNINLFQQAILNGLIASEQATPSDVVCFIRNEKPCKGYRCAAFAFQTNLTRATFEDESGFTLDEWNRGRRQTPEHHTIHVYYQTAMARRIAKQEDATFNGFVIAQVSILNPKRLVHTLGIKTPILDQKMPSPTFGTITMTKGDTPMDVVGKYTEENGELKLALAPFARNYLNDSQEAAA